MSMLDVSNSRNACTVSGLFFNFSRNAFQINRFTSRNRTIFKQHYTALLRDRYSLYEVQNVCIQFGKKRKSIFIPRLCPCPHNKYFDL